VVFYFILIVIHSSHLGRAFLLAPEGLLGVVNPMFFTNLGGQAGGCSHCSGKDQAKFA
jgi:hypothetical protein